MPEGSPGWLSPRIWIFVLATGLLVLAAGVIRQAISMAPSPDGFTGPITHRAPTDGFESDSSSVAAIPDYEEKAQPGFQTRGMLRAGETKTDSFPIEGSLSTAFFLSHPYGNIEFELVSPSGRIYGPSGVPDSGWGYERKDQGLFGMGGPGPTDYLTLLHAEPGMWKARVTARSVPDTMPQVPYLLGSLIETGAGVRVTNFTKERIYHLGESVPLMARVTEGGKGARGAEVTAFLPLDGDSARATTVRLLDDGRAPDSSAGDGKYSGLTPKLRKPGEIFYSIQASRKQASGQSGFDHATNGMLSVSRSRSHWTGRFRDFGVDTTKDGQFDQLTVLAELQVTDSCRISADAELRDSSGTVHQAAIQFLRLGPGRHAIPLEFDGREIFSGGHSGPFVLSKVQLSEEDDRVGSIALLDELKNAYRTKAYDLYAFQRDPHRILGIAGVQGLEQRPDGRYGVLAIDVDVELDREENIQADGWLEAPGASGIHASTVAVYPPGRRKIRLVFPGGCVHELGGHGGYRLRGFILDGQWMNGPERDLDLPVIDVQQYAGPHQLRRPDGMILSECGTQRR